jgi:hypothetical protein
MKKFALSLVLLLLLAVLFYEDSRRQAMVAEVAKSAKAQEQLTRKIEDLNRRVVQAERRAGSVTPERPAGVGGAPAAAAVPEAPAPVPGVTTTAPAGWFKNGMNPGDYVVGVDQNQSYNGQPSAYVKSIVGSPSGFGGMMQSTSAAEYAGKRIRYTAWVRTEDANEGGGHLWFRIDGQQSGQTLGFDNMDKRPLKGTTSWQQQSIVLDVPPEARALAFGFFVGGA